MKRVVQPGTFTLSAGSSWGSLQSTRFAVEAANGSEARAAA